MYESRYVVGSDKTKSPDPLGLTEPGRNPDPKNLNVWTGALEGLGGDYAMYLSPKVDMDHLLGLARIVGGSNKTLGLD